MAGFRHDLVVSTRCMYCACLLFEVCLHVNKSRRDRFLHLSSRGRTTHFPVFPEAVPPLVAPAVGARWVDVVLSQAAASESVPSGPQQDGCSCSSVSTAFSNSNSDGASPKYCSV